MKATLRKMGNSQGVLLPKAVVEQLGIVSDLELTVEDDSIVLRKPKLHAQKDDAAVAAIKFSLATDEGESFLRCWLQGEFDAIRKEWPDAPDEVFVGADPLYKLPKKRSFPMQKLKFKCPECHTAGMASFGGHRTQFDGVELFDNFRLEIGLPNNVLRCDKCKHMLIIVHAEQQRWRVIDAANKSEWRSFADGLQLLHLKLEDEGQQPGDQAMARSLEDKIGCLTNVSVQDICSADELLNKYSL